MSKTKKIWLSIIAVAALMIFVTGVYWFFTFRIVSAPTGSMANTIIPGDSVLCQRISEVKRGEIVLFKLPSDQKVYYLKRVIGLPGDSLQVKGQKVFINGKELPEERAYIKLEGHRDEAEAPVVKVDPKPPDATYRVYWDTDRFNGEDQFDVTQGMKYGVKEPMIVPPNSYFVMGDSRDNSLDSRYWGIVPRELIVSKALMIIVSNAPNGEKRAFKKLQ
ncbi:MAG: signal peptidase I [Acidobacteriota bacterium]